MKPRKKISMRTEHKQSHYKKKIEYSKDGKDFYYNPDGKLVSVKSDDTISYRTAELHEDVIAELNIARQQLNYPSRSLIDSVIHLQEESTEKAVLYVRYRLLGTARYLDVYGDTNNARWAAEKHYSETTELCNKFDEMAYQLQEMQRLMFNIAGTLNKNNTYQRRTG